MPPPRKHPTCGNPLFLGWIGEWLEKAKVEGPDNKMQHVFRKAYASMAAYPLPLPTGADAIVLKGIGKTIADKLEKRLQEYKAEIGLPSSQQYSSSKVDLGSTSPQSKKRKKTSSITTDDSSLDYPANLFETKSSISLDSSTSTNISGFTLKSGPTSIMLPSLKKASSSTSTIDLQSSFPKKKQTKQREYIPQYRSGAFALLVTLYLDSLSPDSPGYMSKADLMKQAAPYSDQAFDQCAPGKLYYTAWSSMSSLIDKGLVHKRGNPAKYFASEDGLKLGMKLWEVKLQRDAAATASPALPNVTAATSRTPDAIVASAFSTSTMTLSNTTTMTSITKTSTTSVGITPRNNIHSDLNLIDLTDSSFSKEIINVPSKQISIKADSSSYQNKSQDLYSSTADMRILFEQENSHGQKSYELNDDTNLHHNNSSISSHSSFPCYLNSNLKTFSPIVSLNPPISLSQNQINVKKSSLSSEISDFTEWTGTPIKFPAGTYDIVIVFDTREQRYGDRAYFVRELEEKYKCRVLQRSLSIGDVVWIAKRKNSFGEGQYEEIVLDYIVERKRRDDLSSSIRDTRYKEQKYRLTNCGLSHIIYILEHHNFQLDPIAEKSINTVRAQIQVVDGIFLKETDDASKTAQFLGRITKNIEKMLKSKDLYAIPSSAISRDTFHQVRAHAERRDNRRYYIPFTTFQESNSKTKSLDVTDVFSKMLLCIRGMTAEKVSIILKKWRTPISLIMALKSCHDLKERMNLITSLTPGEYPRKKKITASLAKKMIHIWCDTTYDSSWG